MNQVMRDPWMVRLNQKQFLKNRGSLFPFRLCRIIVAIRVFQRECIKSSGLMILGVLAIEPSSAIEKTASAAQNNVILHN
jgi:hypothetical protein